MNVLALDTSTSRVSVAAAGPDGIRAAFEIDSGRRHAELLTPTIEAVLHRSDLSVADLDAIAVDVGPGGFTGLRIGLVTAKALAAVAGARVCGVASLDIVAHPLSDLEQDVVVALDARRDELFTARYRAGRRTWEPAVSSPDELVEKLVSEGQKAVVLGAGALRYAERFRDLAGITLLGPGHSWPRASVLADLVQRAPDAATLDDILYVRKPYYT